MIFVRETMESSVLVFVSRDAAQVVLDDSVLSDAQLRALLLPPLHHSGTVASATGGPSGVEGVCLRSKGISAGIWAIPRIPASPALKVARCPAGAG